MAAIPLPDRGQPIDISYLLTMANEVNKMNSIVNAGKTQSSIKYSNSGTKKSINTTDLVIDAQTKKVEIGKVTTFDFSFKFIPIVTTSIQYKPGGQNATGVFPIITSLSSTSCSIELYNPSSLTTLSDGYVSIIAIGEAT